MTLSGERYNYKGLLEDDANLKRWYDNLKRSSPANADKCIQRIGYVCRVFNTTPQEMAKMTSKQASALTLDVLSRLEEEGKQPTYMQDYVKALKSWYLHNEIQILQKMKLPRRTSATKVSQEQSPVPDQLRRVLNASDQKQKVECALVGFAGLREEVVGNYLGDDGLKVKDFPEIRVDNKSRTVEFVKIPTLVIVRPNLSKAGHQYFTFLPEEGCQYLKELLEYRLLRRGEKISADSPIVNSINYNKHLGHIRTNNIGDSIRSAIRKANFDWRPYILRTYFATRLMLAESDGLMIRDWRVFMMGHKGDIEHVYTLNKRLPNDLIEKMREAYAKAVEKYLVTTFSKETMSKDAVLATFNRQFLSLSGYSDAEIEKLGDLSRLAAEDLQGLIRQKSREALGLHSRNNQKVVPLPELRNWVTEGWEYVSLLPNDEAIIRLPR